jgi:hypothetical protein
MDENGIALDFRKPGADRNRALRAAFNRGPNIKAAERCRGLILLASSYDHAHSSHGWVADQRLHGPTEHRLAAEEAVLLRDASAQARAASGGDDERSRGHGGGV